ncbi:MAG: hypothetical protein WCH07_08935 [Deltaproteobacteria bacterium]
MKIIEIIGIITLISVALFIILICILSYRNDTWLKNEYIQIAIFVAIFLQALFLFYQNHTLNAHFQIQQRPVVVVSDIKSIVLSEENLQSKIGNADEFIINITFKNIGQSPAFVEYVKVKIFYGYFFKDGDNVRFHINAMAGGQQSTPLISYTEEVPLGSLILFKDSIFSPNQQESYSTMVDAKELMDNIRHYTTSREAPIFIECEMKYSSSIDKTDTYWYNCIYELQWPLAKHITIYSLLKESNSKDKPLHLTLAQLVQTVAERQQVKSVITALKSGGKDMQEKLQEILK